jgi:hypothetical protein
MLQAPRSELLARQTLADLIAEGAAEAIGAWGSGIGLVALGGELMYDGIKSALDSNAYEADSTKFLQQSDLGLNPGILGELSLPGLSGPASDGLQAYASAYDMTPGQILQKLNHEPGDKAVDFIDEAAGMPQSDGHYTASLPTDDPKQVGTLMVPEPGDKGHNYDVSVTYQADSLRQLNYWATYLFGENGLSDWGASAATNWER